MKKEYEYYLVVAVLLLSVVGLMYGIVSLFGFRVSMLGETSEQTTLTSLSNTKTTETAQFSAKFTAYDIALAKKFMDKDGDGKCDVCGMDIDMCISSGMLQCSGMDPTATIGLLDKV